jgi:hypothetical protein
MWGVSRTWEDQAMPYDSGYIDLDEPHAWLDSTTGEVAGDGTPPFPEGTRVRPNPDVSRETWTGTVESLGWADDLTFRVRHDDGDLTKHPSWQLVAAPN